MSAKLERTKSERFLPYPYVRFGLELSLARVIVDGIDRSASNVDVQARIVALEERKPERVELDVRLGVEEGVLRQVIAEQELGEPPLDLFLAIRCPETRLRRSIPLASAPLLARQFSGKIQLSINDVRGSVELVPFLVRAREGSSRRHARHAGARLASARPWTIRFDLQRPSQGKFLDVRYEPFSKFQDAALWSSALYRLECQLDVPILWLNSDHRELASIFDSKATHGPAARMRDVFFDRISSSVWQQLFITAAEACANEDNEYAWADSVLRRYLPALYPELADHASRVEQLIEHMQNGGIRELIERLDRALQDDLHLVQSMKKLIEETGE
jgi:hypothetical protein